MSPFRMKSTPIRRGNKRPYREMSVEHHHRPRQHRGGSHGQHFRIQALRLRQRVKAEACKRRLVWRRGNLGEQLLLGLLVVALRKFLINSNEVKLEPRSSCALQVEAGFIEPGSLLRILPATTLRRTGPVLVTRRRPQRLFGRARLHPNSLHRFVLEHAGSRDFFAFRHSHA